MTRKARSRLRHWREAWRMNGVRGGIEARIMKARCHLILHTTQRFLRIRGTAGLFISRHLLEASGSRCTQSDLGVDFTLIDHLLCWSDVAKLYVRVLDHEVVGTCLMMILVHL